jgi:hypothetical protein
MSRRWMAIPALSALVLMVAVGIFLTNQQPASTVQPVAVELSVSREAIDLLSWQDLGRMTTLMGTSETSRNYAIGLIGQSTRPQAIYLRALLYLANGQVQAAHSHFSLLDPAALPTTLLYAPYRVAEQISGSTLNPYQPFLLQAARQDQLPPLHAGRVLARAGFLADALAAYLKSDPAAWRRYDMTSLGLLLRHSGLATDTERLLRGAITSQRLQPELQKSLREQLSEPQPDMLTTDQLNTLLVANGSAAKNIKASLRRILSLRQQFLSGDYPALLARHVDSSPALASDEATLLLFIAAVASKDSYQTDRWSQELKRRNTDQETRAWISNLLQKPS